MYPPDHSFCVCIIDCLNIRFFCFCADERIAMSEWIISQCQTPAFKVRWVSILNSDFGCVACLGETWAWWSWGFWVCLGVLPTEPQGVILTSQRWSRVLVPGLLISSQQAGTHELKSLWARPNIHIWNVLNCFKHSPTKQTFTIENWPALLTVRNCLQYLLAIGEINLVALKDPTLPLALGAPWCGLPRGR